MKRSLPTRTLRTHPDLNQLRRQAKELLAAFLGGEPDAVAEVNTHYSSADTSAFALHDAQLVLARAYGFDSWPKLKAHVDGVTVGRLADAVRANDLAQVRAMLEVRPELVNMETGENEQRPIHYAVYNRSLEMVRLLMELGADARKGIWPKRDATSAFTIASERGYDEIVEVILEAESRRPAPARDHDPDAWPPQLVAAARAQDEDRIIAFLEQNPSFISVPYYRMAPLHAAAAALRERLLIWLLDHGADVNARDRNGPSPLELVGCVVEQPDPKRAAAIASILRSRGAELTPRAAVAHGDADWIRARHREGKLVNGLPKNQGYRGLLEIAVTHRRPEMVTLLLELGFDPDEPVRKGDTREYRRGGPLQECAQTGQTDVAEILLARGATLTPQVAVLLGKGDWLREQHAAGKFENPIGDEGGLISLAVRHDREDMLSVLLNLGLDPNERVRVEGLEEIVFSAGGPLRECAQQGKLTMAKILLDSGADPNVDVYAAGSAVFVAYGNKNWEMVKLLEDYGGCLDAASVGYVRQTEIAKKMLGGEIDPKIEKGLFSGATAAEQLVWSGASGGDPEIVRMALQQVDWPHDDSRWFWLLWRPLPGHEPWPDADRDLFIECFRLILQRCDPNLRAERYGQTMLHEVISRDHDDRAELARMLLDAGAKTDIRDDLLKSTPLGWACRWGRIESVKLLLERGADPVEPDAEPWATPQAWAKKKKHQAVFEVLSRFQVS